jgi:hypothetical protein
MTGRVGKAWVFFIGDSVLLEVKIRNSRQELVRKADKTWSNFYAIMKNLGLYFIASREVLSMKASKN